MKNPSSGMLLIADPFLKDPSFSRSVILLCESGDSGSLGLIINKPIDLSLHQVAPDLTSEKIPLYYGGPIQTDSLHFIHQMPDYIPGGMALQPDLIWGGNFETVLALIRNQELNLEKIKIFMGYSGWGKHQLEDELKGKSWMVTSASPRLVFQEKDSQIWKQSLVSMGEDFAIMANFPIDPALN
ncbi:MAG: YqgE/AlgH family protein [Chitinophagaceae bacterium]